ncbi:MAG: hypothetical protein ACLT4Y_09070 [Bifidobacterium breve]
MRQEKVDRVLAAAEKLGYVPSAMASGLASKRTKTLGVVVRNAKLPFYGFLQGAMQKRARERGYQMVSISGVEELSADDARQALRDLIALRVEGLIVCSAMLSVEDFMPFIDRIPFVMAGHEDTTRTVSSVFCDEEDGGRGSRNTSTTSVTGRWRCFGAQGILGQPVRPWHGHGERRQLASA